jgi:hypothetical protein
MYFYEIINVDLSRYICIFLFLGTAFSSTFWKNIKVPVCSTFTGTKNESLLISEIRGQFTEAKLN